MERPANTERGLDVPEAYTSKFHAQLIHIATFRRGLAPKTPADRAHFAGFDAIVERRAKPVAITS